MTEIIIEAHEKLVTGRVERNNGMILKITSKSLLYNKHNQYMKLKKTKLP